MKYYPVVILYSDKFKLHKTENHIERVERLDVIWDAIKKNVTNERYINSDVCIVKEDIPYLIHDSGYVDEIKNLCSRINRTIYLDADTQISPKTYESALFAMNAVLQAVNTNKSLFCICLVRPPGHHVGRFGGAYGRTQGFCIFNNVVGGVIYARDKGQRPMIIDIDAHHGNGTQELLYEIDIPVIDIHQSPRTLYPGTGYIEEIGQGRGEGYQLNIPLEPLSGDDVFKVICDEIVDPVLLEYKPNIVFVSLGFDSHELEDISSLKFTEFSYVYLFKLILKYRVKVIAVLEGGYSRGLRTISDVINLPELSAPKTKSDKKCFEPIHRCKKIFSEYFSYII